MTNPTLDAKATAVTNEEAAPSVVTDTELPDGKDTLTKEHVVSYREYDGCDFAFHAIGDKASREVRLRGVTVWPDCFGDTDSHADEVFDITLSTDALRRLTKMLDEVSDGVDGDSKDERPAGKVESVRINRVREPDEDDTALSHVSFEDTARPEDKYERAAREWEIASARLDRQWGLRTVAAQILATVITSLGAWWYCRHTGNYEILWFFVEAWFAVMSLMLVFLMVVPAIVDTIRKRRYLKGLKAEADKAAQTSFTVDTKEAA